MAWLVLEPFHEHRPGVKLSFAQKEQFFHELTQSLRSGKSLPETLERSAKKRFGTIPKLSRQMVAGSGEGSASEYFGAAPRTFSNLDCEMVVAGASGGRLDAVTGYLSSYYESLARTRRRIIGGLTYPIVLLHVAAVLLAVPKAVSDGPEAFGWAVAQVLGVFYAALIVVWLLVAVVSRAVQRSALADRIVMKIPIIGGARRALVASRFCQTLNILIRSGAGILGSIDRAGEVGGSALFREGAGSVTEDVRRGERLGEAVEASGAFPEDVIRGFEIGEDSGRLDDEMERLATRYDEQLKDRLAALAAWTPKIIYSGIAIFIGYRIVTFYVGYLDQVNRLLEQM